MYGHVGHADFSTTRYQVRSLGAAGRDRDYEDAAACVCCEPRICAVTSPSVAAVATGGQSTGDYSSDIMPGYEVATGSNRVPLPTHRQTEAYGRPYDDDDNDGPVYDRGHGNSSGYDRRVDEHAYDHAPMDRHAYGHAGHPARVPYDGDSPGRDDRPYDDDRSYGEYGSEHGYDEGHEDQHDMDLHLTRHGQYQDDQRDVDLRRGQYHQNHGNDERQRLENERYDDRYREDRRHLYDDSMEGGPGFPACNYGIGCSVVGCSGCGPATSAGYGHTDARDAYVDPRNHGYGGNDHDDQLTDDGYHSGRDEVYRPTAHDHGYRDEGYPVEADDHEYPVHDVQSHGLGSSGAHRGQYLGPTDRRSEGRAYNNGVGLDVDEDYDRPDGQKKNDYGHPHRQAVYSQAPGQPVHRPVVEYRPLQVPSDIRYGHSDGRQDSGASYGQPLHASGAAEFYRNYHYRVVVLQGL